MYTQKNIWADEELRAIWETADTLRRMRTAATRKPSPLKAHIRKIMFRITARDSEPDLSSKQILSLAEELGRIAGKYMAKKVFPATQPDIELEQWQNMLLAQKKKFGQYSQTTYARTKLEESVVQSLFCRVRHLEFDPEHILKWDLMRNNNLGTKTLKNLEQQKIGVISPLSCDYFLACIYSQYLRIRNGRSFEVGAAATSKNLDTVVLSATSDRLCIENSEIALYIDTTETGNSARALREHIRHEYPDTRILAAPKKIPDFNTSPKVTRALLSMN